MLYAMFSEYTILYNIEMCIYVELRYIFAFHIN